MLMVWGFFKNKISVSEIELQVRIKSIKSRQPSVSYIKKCSSNFSISECYFLDLKKLNHRLNSPPPPPPSFLRERGVKFSKFCKKMIRFFPMTMESLVKQVGYNLSLSIWCVCVLFIYTISISIIYASPSHIAYNQQIYDFYK